MKKDNYILEVLDYIKYILESNEYRKERYEHDVIWFNQKQKQIKNNIIRIAIMGITSSGKSTLVNAILGEKLLPVAIKPSSSIIITCSKDEERKAVIYFRDKEPKILKVDELNDEVIKQYADESMNENNKLNVTQIDITSPKFLLEDNIHIIDSPGLDACDLEMHEKLTMEILLPTIDICIFLTTVKANSDRINVEKIRLVNEKEKQIILVQNMIDSVEDKIGKGGIVEENKEIILKKHKERAEKILSIGTCIKGQEDKEDDADNTDKNSKFEVIQISALNALNGIINNDKDVYEESNLDEFIKMVELCVKNIMPKINKDRGVSIINKIDNIVALDKELIKGSRIEDINSLMAVSTCDVDDLVDDFKVARDKISLRIKAIDKIIDDTIKEMTKSKSEQLEEYESIVHHINKENSAIENEILDIVKECEESKNELCEKLNIDTRINYSLPSVEYENIDVLHKYEEKTRFIEKEGVINKGKRMLSHMFETSWGYETEEYDQKVVDKDATINKAKEICKHNRMKYTDLLWNWSNQYSKYINILYIEVNKKTLEYENKKGQRLEINDIEGVTGRLKTIKSELIKKTRINSSSLKFQIDHKDADSKIEESHISNLNYNLYKLTNEIIEKNYVMVGKYVSEGRHNVFWSWDEESCIKFIARVCGIYLNEAQIEEIRKDGLFNYRNITVVYEEDKNKIKLYENLRKLYGSKYNIYVIFNAIQIGNSQKQVEENMLLREFVLNNDVIFNLVIDSFNEFVNGQNIEELLLEVNYFKNKLKDGFVKDKMKYMLMNVRNPIYNMALIECQQKENFIISDYKEVKERLFRNSLLKSREEREIIEKVLSFFLEYKSL